MTDILFNVTLAPPTGPLRVEVSGPAAINTSNSPYVQINGQAFSHTLLCIDLQNGAGSTLWSNESNHPQNSFMFPNGQPNLPPGVANLPADGGLCCEVRNSSANTIQVDLYVNGVIDGPIDLAPDASTFFVTQGLTDDNTRELLAETRFQADPCCVPAGTRFRTPGATSARVEDLRAGDCVLDQAGRPVPLRSCVRFDVPTRRFYRVPADPGTDTKAAPLLICAGHPLLDRATGRETLPEELAADGRAEAVTLEQPATVYTLVTERRGFLATAGGHLVGSWSRAAWDNFAQKDAALRFSAQ